MGFISDSAIGFLRGTDGGLRLGIFFQLDTSPALHIWMGIGDINMQTPFGVSNETLDGTKFLGAGRLLNVPDLELLINGIANRIFFEMSGVDANFQAQIDAAAIPVKGALAHIGLAPLDTRWQPQTNIIPLWQGVADFWTMEQKASEDTTKPPTRSITLSLGYGDTRRAVPRPVTFTDPAQKLIHPTDDFFDRVSRYVPGLAFAWPRF